MGNKTRYEAVLEKSQKIFTELVGQQRFVYHILTSDRYGEANAVGHLLSRKALGMIRNDLAMKDLVAIRSSIQLDNDNWLHDTVPFYMTPRQPMFCRLVRERQLRTEELMALGFDFDALYGRYKHWLFTSNPAYKGSRLLGQWDKKGNLAWNILLRWWWNNDNNDKEEKLRCSFLRQSELLVKGPISLEDVHHIVIDDLNIMDINQQGIARKNVVRISGVFKW